jgi:two-component system, LytTR family, response regulator LytT
MKIVIIEDEKITADELANTITALEPDITIEAILDSVQNAVAYFDENEEPDLIFSDVQLGDGLSFEIFNTCKISAPVIFCTAYDEYALNAFKTNSIDYILKPSTSKIIANALAKYRNFRKTFFDSEQQYKAILEILAYREAAQNTSILVLYKDKIVPVWIEDIALFYIENEVTHLVTFNSKAYTINKNLEELERISGRSFFRVNRQCLINRKSIVEASHYFSQKLSITIAVPFKEKIMVSKEKAPLFLKWLESVK